MSNRKKKSSKSHGGQSASPKAFPPFRTLERAFAAFGDGAPDDTPLHRAQELIYQAFEIPNPAKRIALARQALAISTDCADAYVLLADEQAHTLEETLAYYEQGVAAGERALGPQVFEDSVGHFWGLIETRPYMRARLGLAEMLWTFGDRSVAISHAQALLQLNPNDNQGVRNLLIDWLLLAGRVADAKALWQQYADDGMAYWAYSRALIAYLEQGAGAEAQALLAEAIAANPHVPPLLLGRVPLPAASPEYMRLGEPTEAAAYVIEALHVWDQSDGALRWLSRELKPGSGGRM